LADHLPDILGKTEDGTGKTCKVCGARADFLHDMKEEKEVACGAAVPSTPWAAGWPTRNTSGVRRAK
jgi:hypothetical protein